jgi:hypothetical protein
MEPRRGIAAQEMFGLLIDCPTVAMERNRGVGTVLMPIKADFADVEPRAGRDCFASLAMTKLKDCHCEERSDEAIPIQVAQVDRNAPVGATYGVSRMAGREQFYPPNCC